MRDEQREPTANAHQVACDLDAEGHCITCSDEALPARVLRVDQQAGLALVRMLTAQDTTEEIDITLVDNVALGDVLLVHGGVAIGEAPAELFTVRGEQ